MNTSLRSRILQVAIGIAICAMPLNLAAQTMVPWLTRSADNSRSGWNSQETVLSQASVCLLYTSRCV